MKQIVIIIFILQGLCNVLALGSSSRPIDIGTAVAFALIALGLWKARRLAYFAAMLIELAQVITVSTNIVSWHLLVGPSAGLFVTLPFSQAEYGGFWHFGVLFHVAIDEPSTWLPKAYPLHSSTFVLFNAFSAFLFALLLRQYRRVKRQPMSLAAIGWLGASLIGGLAAAFYLFHEGAKPPQKPAIQDGVSSSPAPSQPSPLVGRRMSLVSSITIEIPHGKAQVPAGTPVQVLSETADGVRIEAMAGQSAVVHRSNLK